MGVLLEPLLAVTAEAKGCIICYFKLRLRLKNRKGDEKLFAYVRCDNERALAVYHMANIFLRSQPFHAKKYLRFLYAKIYS